MRLGVLSWRTRFGRIALVMGIALAIGRLLPSPQQKQPITFDLSDIGEQTTAARVQLTPQSGSEPVGEFELNLPSPHPRRITHTVSVIDGDYRLQIELRAKHGSSAPETTREYRVSLDGGEVIVFLHEG